MAKLATDILQSEYQSKQDGHALSILVAEDSKVQRLLLAHLLEKLGHTVSVASNGFEALSAIQLNRCYDVVFMDCQMPLMDGLQATRFIRELEHQTGQQMAIIGMSAVATFEECFTVGMDDFLCKPLSKLILKAVLGRWIRQKKGCTHWRRGNVD